MGGCLNIKGDTYMKIETATLANETFLENMPEAGKKKLKVARTMILLSAGTYLVSLISAILPLLSYNRTLGSDFKDYNLESINVFSVIGPQSLLIMGLSIYAVKILTKSQWGWVVALSALGLSTLTWAFPFALFGILMLLDRDVRGFFIKELDINL